MAIRQLLQFSALPAVVGGVVDFKSPHPQAGEEGGQLLQLLAAVAVLQGVGQGGKSARFQDELHGLLRLKLLLFRAVRAAGDQIAVECLLHGGDIPLLRHHPGEMGAGDDGVRMARLKFLPGHGEAGCGEPAKNLIVAGFPLPAHTGQLLPEDGGVRVQE